MQHALCHLAVCTGAATAVNVAEEGLAKGQPYWSWWQAGRQAGSVKDEWCWRWLSPIGTDVPLRPAPCRTMRIFRLARRSRWLAGRLASQPAECLLALFGLALLSLSSAAKVRQLHSACVRTEYTVLYTTYTLYVQYSTVLYCTQQTYTTEAERDQHTV